MLHCLALIVGAIYLLAPLPYPPGPGIARWVRRLRRLTGTARRAIIVIPVPYAIESGLRDGIGAARTHGPGAAVVMGLTAAALNVPPTLPGQGAPNARQLIPQTGPRSSTPTPPPARWASRRDRLRGGRED